MGHDYAKEKVQRQEAVVAELSRLANSMGQPNHAPFINAMQNEHRTLQQGMGGLFFSIIRDYGEKYDNERIRYFDGRNEQFGKFCSEINKHMAESHYKDWNRLPFI